METGKSIPVIDLQDFPAQSSKLIKACEDLGCFRIINHDNVLPRSLMEEMKSVVTSLLDLPREIKLRNRDIIGGSGYVPPTETNPLYEALGLFDLASSEAIRDFCTQLDASPHQRVIISRYAQAINQLVNDIAQKVAQGLGVASFSFEGWPCQFRINKYSFTEQSIGSYGVQVHTDSGFLTILQEDENVGGLEILDKSGCGGGVFFAIDPSPGSLLVNLGDVATVWSNGRLHNVKHRVMCKEAAIRVSIATFLLGPRKDAIEPPLQLVDSQNPRLYKPVTFEEYRDLRLSTKMRAGEALSLVRAKDTYLNPTP